MENDTHLKLMLSLVRYLMDEEDVQSRLSQLMRLQIEVELLLHP